MNLTKSSFQFSHDTFSTPYKTMATANKPAKAPTAFPATFTAAPVWIGALEEAAGVVEPALEEATGAAEVAEVLRDEGTLRLLVGRMICEDWMVEPDA